jgi:adenylate cyclase
MRPFFVALKGLTLMASKDPASGLGLRPRFLAAFLGVSAFAVLAAAIAGYALVSLGHSLDNVTEERVPSALASLNTSRQVERLVSAAPTLVAARSAAELAQAQREIDTGVSDLGATLSDLLANTIDTALASEIVLASDDLRANLDLVAGLIGARLELANERRRLTASFTAAQNELRRLISPGTLQMDEQVTEFRNALSDQALVEAERDQLAAALGALLLRVLPHQNSQVELTALGEIVSRAERAENPGQIAMLGFPTLRSIDNLIALSATLPDEVGPGVAARTEALRRLITGPEGIHAVRMQELGLIEEAGQLLSDNRALSIQLAGSVDALVSAATASMEATAIEARQVRDRSFAMLIVFAALSIVSSVLIVWLFVDRNLLARIGNLRDGMLAIAAGDLRANLPNPGPDELGRMAQALHVFRDTAVEIEERNLRDIAEARTRLLDAIESISEGFALFDQTDHLILCNNRYRQMLVGTGAAFEPGAAYAALLHQAAHSGRVSAASGREAEWVFKAMNRDDGHGEELIAGRWLQLTEHRVSGGGKVIITADITALKERQHLLELARDKAMDATRTKSQFLANMSHELRTPLNAIIGLTDMMREDAEEADDENLTELVEPLSRVHSAGKHLLGLINEILDLSKIEAGKIDIAPEDIDIATMVRDVLVTAKTLADRNNNVMSAECEPDLGTLHADPMRLRQICLNLLSNACKFTESGTITVNARIVASAGGLLLVLSVQDTGIGMSEEQLGRMFQEFSQADASTSRKYGGTGLGLAISRKLARMMGGDIEVTSELGVGTCFTLTLPKGLAAVNETNIEQAFALARNSEGPVLVIDDELSARQIIERILKKEGIETVIATNAREGLQKAHEVRPCLITLDVMMPDLDGWWVLRHLKEDPELANIPVIMISIFEEQNRAFTLGASDYVTKPVDPARLRAALQKFGAKSTRKTGLIVDDDADARALMARVLNDQGWEVVEAENGIEGLKALDEYAPDIVLLDLAMPEMDGFGFMAALRERQISPRPAVLVVTAADLTEQDRQRLDGGVMAFLTKSESIREDITSALRGALGPQNGQT